LNELGFQNRLLPETVAKSNKFEIILHLLFEENLNARSLADDKENF